MIPNMILLGLILGRWWKTALVIGTVTWPAILLHAGIITPRDIPGAALLGLLNAAIGTGIHQGVLRLFRRARTALTRQAPQP